MQFGQKLDLKQSQNLTMSPQLQQAIKLLQMTNFELDAFLEDQFQNNPLLEIIAPESDERISDTSSQEKSDFEPQDSEIINDNSFSDAVSDRITDSPEANYQSLDNYKNLNGSSNSHENDERQHNFTQEPDLRQYLSKQLYGSSAPQDIMLIASYLIGSLSDTGYLHESCAEVSGILMQPIEKVEKALELCQQFDPPGVFARNLGECLKLQLIDRGIYNKHYQALLDNLEDLASNKQSSLVNKVGVSKAQLIQMVMQIKKLYPKPGLQYSNDPIIPVIPDVFITESASGGWYVALNHATMPKAIINQSYSVYLDKKNKDKKIEKDTKRYLRESYNQASWLIKSLEQRSETILRVASEILRQQDGFFAYGFEYLKPMNLKTVAEELELHESTVSRVTTGKYLRCPRGIFEMKFFFMSGITGSDGEGTIASEFVKHEIKKIINNEDPKKIISDGDIVDILQETKDITIARRTVAKYREAMNIPSSVKRRSQKNGLV